MELNPGVDGLMGKVISVSENTILSLTCTCTCRVLVEIYFLSLCSVKLINENKLNNRPV